MEKFISEHTFLFVAIVVLAIIDLVLRLIALWNSARRNQKVWFVFLGVVNSLGILPIIYLLLHRSKKG